MPPMPTHGGAGPSTKDKLIMGGIMGGTVGSIMGFLYGATTIMRYGAGPNGIGRTLGQYMLASGSTFGFFMAIGSVIRTEAASPRHEAHFRFPRTIVIAETPPRTPADARPRRR